MNLLVIIDALAEISLAAAAIYVVRFAFLGLRRERSAQKSSSEGERHLALVDAKIFYLFAGFQQPWVWFLVFAGSFIKLVLAASKIFTELGNIFVQ